MFVPALNGLATQGETLGEAREMARDAIEGYIECLKDKGIPIPVVLRCGQICFSIPEQFGR